MSVVALGGFTIGEACGGIRMVVDPLAAALATLKAQAEAAATVVLSVKVTLDGALSALADAVLAVRAAIDLHLSGLDGAKASIRFAALVDIQAQLDACLALQLSLGVSLTDPALYLSGLLQGLLQVKANLDALVPQVAVSAQLSASLSIAASLEAKIVAFDLVLGIFGTLSLSLSAAIDAAFSGLAAITASLQAQADASAALVVALNAAVAGAVSPLSLAVDLQAKFSLSTVFGYVVTDQLGSLGDVLDAAITATPPGGLPLSEPMKAWLLAVPTSATDAVSALESLLKSTP